MANKASQQFDIQRIYTKDISLESPSSPQLFQQPWEPEVHVDLNVSHNNLNEHLYEIMLRVTVTVKNNKRSGLIVEVVQAGIFHVDGFDDEQMDHMLKAYCPNLLFYYAREAISSLSVRASFPPINLAPVNFDAIYAQQKRSSTVNDRQIDDKQ